jgi:hypothetical protein
MSTDTNPASPGYPQPVVAEQPVRAPLDGFTPWTTPGAPAVGSLPLGFAEQVVRIPDSVVDFLGQPMNRR